MKRTVINLDDVDETNLDPMLQEMLHAIKRRRVGPPPVILDPVDLARPPGTPASAARALLRAGEALSHSSASSVVDDGDPEAELRELILNLCFASRKQPHFKELFMQALAAEDDLSTLMDMALDCLRTMDKLKQASAKYLVAAQTPLLRGLLGVLVPTDFVPNPDSPKAAAILELNRAIGRAVEAMPPDGLLQGMMQGPCPILAFGDGVDAGKHFEDFMRRFFFLRLLRPLDARKRLPADQPAFALATRTLQRANISERIHIYAEALAAAFDVHARTLYEGDKGAEANERFVDHVGNLCRAMPLEFTPFFIDLYPSFVGDAERYGLPGNYATLREELFNQERLAALLKEYSAQVLRPEIKLTDYQSKAIVAATQQELMSPTKVLADQAGIRGLVFAMDPGVGKTLIAMMIARFAPRMRGRVDGGKTLFIIPKVAEDAFRSQVRDLFVNGGEDEDMFYLASLNGLGRFSYKKDQFYASSPYRPMDARVRCVIVTHDLIATIVPGSMAAELFAISWDRIFLDESHMWMGRLTKRYGFTQALFKRAAFYCMTGTMVQTCQADVVTQIRLLGYRAVHDNSKEVQEVVAKYTDADNQPNHAEVVEAYREKRGIKIKALKGKGKFNWFALDNELFSRGSNPCFNAIHRLERPRLTRLFLGEYHPIKLDVEIVDYVALLPHEALVNALSMRRAQPHARDIEEYWNNATAVATFEKRQEKAATKKKQEGEVPMEDAGEEEAEANNAEKAYRQANPVLAEVREEEDLSELKAQRNAMTQFAEKMQNVIKNFATYRLIACDIRVIPRHKIANLKGQCTKITNSKAYTDEVKQLATDAQAVLGALAPYDPAWLEEHVQVMLKDVPETPDTAMGSVNGPSSRTLDIQERINAHLDQAPDNKAIVFFSDLVNMLAFGRRLSGSTLGARLMRLGKENTDGAWIFAYYASNLTNVQRHEVIDSFRTNPRTRVLLLTLKMGATSLNLQAANMVIFAQPTFKYTDYFQGYSRAYRLGQTRPVTVLYYWNPDSCEKFVQHVHDTRKQHLTILDVYLNVKGRVTRVEDPTLPDVVEEPPVAEVEDPDAMDIDKIPQPKKKPRPMVIEISDSDDEGMADKFKALRISTPFDDFNNF